MTRQRARAAGAVAAGDQARTLGRVDLARDWYEEALRHDARSKEAAAGLAAVEKTGGGHSMPPATVMWGPMLGRLGLAFLGVVLTALLAARALLGLIVPAHDSKPRPRNRTAIVAGVVAAFGALGVALVAAGHVTIYGLGLLVPSVAMLTGGTWSLVVWWGRRLAVQVEVRKEKDTDNASTAQLLGRLTALGSERPEGFLLPRGTDVVTLPTDALAELPHGKILQALTKLALKVLPVSPWRASVTLTPAAAVVDLRRNGRAYEVAELAAIDIAKTADATARDHVLLTGAAAWILLRMSSAHPELQQGLCGTTRWRSLAKQVLSAEPPFGDDTSVSVEILTSAVEADPANKAAWYRLLVLTAFLEREAVDGWRGAAARLDALYTGLNADQLEDRGYAALRIRICYASAVAWLRHIEELGPTRTPERAAARLHMAVSAHTMRSEARKLVKDRGASRLRQFAEEALPIAESLVSTGGPAHALPRRSQPWLAPQDQHLKTFVTLAPRALYVKACHLARAGHSQQALDALGLAVGLPFQRSGARSDPALNNLRTSPVFVQLIAGQTPLAALPGMGAREPQLNALHLRVPADLLGSTIPDSILQDALQLTSAELELLRAQCLLAVTCPNPRSAPEWITLLAATGITTSDELQDRQTEPVLTAILAAQASALANTPPTADDLTAWATKACRPPTPAT
ncbi:hypothetical protein R8Z50_21940 [Longispora sp. K20-0274]|uniref:TPR end-of-group domain-containing protein n=1 Tax=Longispora sp. K20-0274 TaxID=3088255 RepID=UPI00399BA535